MKRWLTFILLVVRLLLLHYAALLLLPLSEHFTLEAGDRVKQLIPANLRGGEDHTAVQKMVDGCQQVLPVISLVCHLMKMLKDQTEFNLQYLPHYVYKRPHNNRRVGLPYLT